MSLYPEKPWVVVLSGPYGLNEAVLGRFPTEEAAWAFKGGQVVPSFYTISVFKG